LGTQHRQEFKRQKQQVKNGSRQRRAPDTSEGIDRPDNWKATTTTHVELYGPEEWPRDTCKPPSDTRPLSAKCSKGFHLDNNRFYTDHRRPVPQKPITKGAIKLLAEYQRRRAFMAAIANGAPIDWAGDVFLRVGKSRAHEIHNEMALVGPSPYEWFIQRFIEGLASKTIGEGRATEQSALANCLYIELAGGQAGWNHIRMKSGGRHKIVLKELRETMDVIDREVNDYGIYSLAFQKGEDQ
jgi:hypothetical protein